MADDLSAIVSGEAERLGTGYTFTEGPLWHHDGYLLFVDVRESRLYRWYPGQRPFVVREDTGGGNGLTFDSQGQVIMCQGGERRVVRLDSDFNDTVVADNWDGKRLNRPNDVVCRSDGNIYFTDPSNGCHLVGHQGEDLQKYLDYEGVYRLDAATGELTLLNDDMVFPNGLCFSPDESLMYVNDTTRHYIRVFDVLPDGTLANPRHFADLHGADVGHPDGIKVDTEGNVYCTGPGGVWVMDPQGNHLGLIRTPEPCHNFTIGGEDLKTIFFACRTTIYRMGIKARGIAVCGN